MYIIAARLVLQKCNELKTGMYDMIKRGGMIYEWIQSPDS